MHLAFPRDEKRGHGENVQSIICDVDQSASDQWEFYDWHIAGNWPFVWVLWMGIIKNLSIKTPLLHRPSRAWLQVYYSSSLGERVVILYRKGQPLNGPNTLGLPGLYLGVSIICFHDYSLIMSQAFMVWILSPFACHWGTDFILASWDNTLLFFFFSFQTGGLNLV